MTTRSTLWLIWAYGFFALAGLADNRAFLLGAAAVAALGVIRSLRTAPARS